MMKMENADALNVRNVWIVGTFVRRTKILNAIMVDASAVERFLYSTNVMLTVTARKDVGSKVRLVLAKKENAFA